MANPELDQSGYTPTIDETTESTSCTSPNIDLKPEINFQTKSSSDDDSIFKYCGHDMPSKNEEPYCPSTVSVDIVPKLEFSPKKYQTVLTNQNEEKKRTRGRPSKYNLQWEDATKPKEYDPKVVQCCLCFRNLLFGCNGQKVFKKHRHFETNNIICSFCQMITDAKTTTTNTNQSQNTYEKLEHVSEITPGSIKPVTKVVYVVRPPSEIDNLIIKKPRKIYKKRRILTPALIDDSYESSSYNEENCIEDGASSSHTNNMKHASTTTTHLWPQSSSIDNQTTSYDDDYDDDDDDDCETNYDDNDEILQRNSSKTMFVKVGKPRSSGNGPLDLRTSRKRQKPAVVDDYLKTNIKSEPVDPEYEFSVSNSSFEKNLDIEVKVENEDPTQEHYSQTYDRTAVEQPLQYEDEDSACFNSGIVENTDSYIPSFENSEKDPCPSEHFQQTSVNVGSAMEEPPQSQDLVPQSQDLVYIYLSNQEDTSLHIPRSSGENERSGSPGDNCVAVIPVLPTKEYISKEKETE